MKTVVMAIWCCCVSYFSLGNLIDDTKSIQVPGSLEKSFCVIIQLRFPVRLEVCL